MIFVIGVIFGVCLIDDRLVFLIFIDISNEFFLNFILSCEGKGSGEDRPQGTSFTAHSSSCHSVQFPFHSYFPVCAYIPLKLGEYLPGDIISLIPPMAGG